jgi:hypothetical protein
MKILYNFVHFRDFAVLILQLNVSFEQLSDSFGIQNFELVIQKQKQKVKKLIMLWLIKMSWSVLR